MQSLAFGYDTANRITKITNGINAGMTETLGYNALSRLTSVASGADNESYQYDPDGNRTTATVNGVAQTYTTDPASNKLTAFSSSLSAQYGYDAKGNTQLVNGSVAYQYNPFNRLTNAGGATNYVNPEGQRLRKSGGSTGTTYFAPGMDGELAAENDNGTWVDYVRLNGRLIGRVSGGQVYAIHADQVDRPEEVTDASKAVVWRAQNYPFMRTVTLANVTLNLGFPGQYADAETWTWNNGFRDYNAGFGRYLESDPIGLAGGVNTYAYVGWNPLSYTDPLGLKTFQIGFSFTYNLSVSFLPFHLAGTIGGGAAFDDSGQIAPYTYYGGGTAWGSPGGVFGVQLEGSNAETVQDLAGPFNNLSGDVADAYGGAIDGFWGKNHDGCKNVLGGGVTLGGGAGAFLFNGITRTQVYSAGHLW